MKNYIVSIAAVVPANYEVSVSAPNEEAALLRALALWKKGNFRGVTNGGRVSIIEDEDAILYIGDIGKALLDNPGVFIEESDN